jgi:hypothetical protein
LPLSTPGATGSEQGALLTMHNGTSTITYALPAKVTAATDGFNFLGWNFKVQSNGKFRSTPSVDNYKAFRKKVKHIVNNSNYGATTKAEKLAPVVRGWRNYHKFCKMDGSRNSLYHIEKRAYKVFNKETKQNRYSSKKLLDKAFPAVSYSENKHVMVKGAKSPSCY